MKIDIGEFFRRITTLKKSENSLSDLLDKARASALGSTIRAVLHEAATSALVEIVGVGLQDTEAIVERVAAAATKALTNVSPELATEIQKAVGSALDKGLPIIGSIAADKIPGVAASVAEAVAGLLKV